jgi:hypothetical protein
MFQEWVGVTAPDSKHRHGTFENMARTSSFPQRILGSWPIAAAMGAGILLLAGCDSGPRIVPASGRVLMNGKPLTGHVGFVRVVPAGSRASTGRIDPADGRFTLTTYKTDDGCVEGSHPTAVIVNTTVGNRLVWIAPERYGDDATSGLKVEVKGPTSDLELHLEGRLTPVPTATEAERRMQEAG